MELQVTNSPFNQEQIELLNRVLPTLSTVQRIWLSGYFAALQGQEAALSLPAAESPQQANLSTVTNLSKDVTILFGSQTGNSNGLAKKMATWLEDHGFQATVCSMSDFKPNTLKKLHHLLIIVSTHGAGEPPDNALAFHEFLHSKRAPKLGELRYSVLALGDTSYEFFCQTGKDFDHRLEELGAQRIVPRVDCDVDFDEPASGWMQQVIQELGQTSAASASANTSVSASSHVGSEADTQYSRTNPFHAEVLENLNLNGRGAERETRHIELSLEGSNLRYEPGDSLGIYPENDPRLVDELINTLGWKPEESITLKNGAEVTLRDALLRHYEITVLTKPLLEQAAQLVPNSEISNLLEAGNEQKLRSYIEGRDLLDLVQDYNLQEVPAPAFTAILRKIRARLYSIASSPKAFPDEVHLTVRTVRYETHGRNRYGVCSVQLAERVQCGDKLPVYVQHNPSFKLPENPDAPVIMIGPGTGVAPFRAFLEEREESGATGKTWLFYGDQHFSTDFLYQIEWQRWLKEGVLSRMDVAFSRDTKQKVYVQHRMLEKSRDLYQWLQEGAYLYICGDAQKMAHDVHAALGTILQQEGGLSPEEATEYLMRMQQEKRYQRDVY